MKGRREFIKNLSGTLAALTMAGGMESFALEGGEDKLGMVLPLRNLGNTGKKVTMLGLGGYHVGCFMNEKEAEKTVRTALETGVRFFDSARAYCEGETERRLGKFLPHQHRERIFLMNKTKAYDGKTALAQLDGALSDLKTDYLDLWQVHNIFSLDNLDLRIQNGILEVMQKAKASGKVKHIGFTGHANPAVHRKMLDETDIFETCQLPLNAVDPHYLSFTTEVLPELVHRQMGVIVIKSLGGGSFFSKPDLMPTWSVDDPVVPAHISIRQALNYVWSLPVSVIVTGADNAEMLREKVKLAREFKPLSEAERLNLIDKVADTARIAEMNYKTENI